MNYLLVGRPNVGKSSIFNILTAKKNNIIHSDEGTTRDWHKEVVPKTSSYLYDTPGLLIDQKNKKKIINPNLISIFTNEVNIFLYVTEYNMGFNEIDNFSINQLRKFNKRIILIINKFDNYNLEPNNEFNKYGIKEKLFVSCSHNFGFDTVKKILEFKQSKIDFNNKVDFSFAIFGKPNAGKSTFLNSIVGYNRSLTSPQAGTTSDYVIDYFRFKNKYIKIIDTAGIGKKSNIKNNSINYLSVKKAFESIYKVDSGIIIIDSNEGLDRQDKRIIKLVSEKSKSVILIFNKIDLINSKNEFKSEIISDIENSISEIKNIKIFFISSLKKNDVTKIINYLLDNILFHDYKISTSKLNQWLKKVVQENQHPLIENKRVNFKYATQIKTSPVTIKIFCSYSNKLRNNYKRYLVNNFNYHFKILNQKTKFIYSSSINPYI